MRRVTPATGESFVALKVNKVGRKREQIEAYLGFGAEIVQWGDGDYGIINVPREHAGWLKDRLASGWIGAEPVDHEFIQRYTVKVITYAHTAVEAFNKVSENLDPTEASVTRADLDED